MQIKRIIKFFVVMGILIITIPVLAVELNLKSDIETINVGQKFWLDIMIDTEGEAINAVHGIVDYPQDQLSLVNINNGDSIISSWIEVPNLKSGQAVFAGIVPGGFSGVLSPFYSGAAPGKIISLQFLVIKGGEIKVGVDDLQVLLHDGFGTPINTHIVDFEIIPTENIISTPVKEEIKDFDPPEPFLFQIIKDENIFENQYILIFNTQDKDSGIDHYEVQEGSFDFVIAQSPYLLKNQNLDGKIIVKAIDRAGNERISRVGPPKQKSFLRGYWRLLIGLLIFIMLILSYFLRKHIRNNKD